MRVMNQQIVSPLRDTRAMGVLDRQPVIFLSPAAFESPLPGWSTCGTQQAFGQSALALNADGTLNSCTNPATAGSTVTVFLNGFGPVTPPLGTGIIAPNPAAALTPSMDPGPLTRTPGIATKKLPGAIKGVAQVQM